MTTLADIKRHLAKPVFRDLQLADDAIDEEKRTVRIAAASDQPVGHFFGDLALSMDAKNVRDSRLRSGLAALVDHNRSDQIGVVDEYSVDKKDGMLRMSVRFSRSARGEEIFQDVKDRIRRNVSIGFMIHELHLEKEEKDAAPLYRSDDWEPLEVSFVSVPADISVGVGRTLNFNNQMEDMEMSTQTAVPETVPQAAEQNAAVTPQPNRAADPSVDAVKRTQAVLEFAEMLGERELALDMITQSAETTVEDVRIAVQQKLRAAPPNFTEQERPEDVAFRQGGVQLAASMPRYGELRAFKGEGAERRAYRFGQFLAASIYGRKWARDYCSKNGIALERGQSEGDNALGGYLVPEEFGNDMIDLREQFGVFRRNANVVPMASDRRTDPITKTALTAHFTDEGDDAELSEMKWGRVGLTAKKLMVFSRYTSELSEDAVISVGDAIARDMAWAIAQKEDQCGFNGDGTSTFGGIVGVRERLKNLSVTVANIAGLQVGTGNAYSELILTDFIQTAGRLPEFAEAGSVKWYCSKSFYYNVMVKLALAAGGVTAAEIEGKRGNIFLGYPVEFTSVMPKTEANSQVCALFGNLAMAANFGERRGFELATSEHSKFQSDQIEVRGKTRFDINVHSVGNESAQAADRKAGPIVGLITAAS